VIRNTEASSEILVRIAANDKKIAKISRWSWHARRVRKAK
jgi:hypothetical protein